MILFYHERVKRVNDFQLIDPAASGHLQLVKYLDGIGSTASHDAMNNAAKAGHLEVVKFLLKSRSEGCTKAALDNAAFAGHLETIKWLHENRSEGCTTYAMVCCRGRAPGSCSERPVPEE